MENIGFAVITGEDNVYLLPSGAGRRLGIGTAHLLPMVIGEAVRDWAVNTELYCVWPCDPHGKRLEEDSIKRFWSTSGHTGRT